MKKLLVLLLLLALLLTGCGGQRAMVIETAKLTKAEENIKKLLGTTGGSELIYDFSVDENVKSLQINTYELVDRQWKQTSGGGGLGMEGKSGRLALSFDLLGEDLRVAIQNGDQMISAFEFHSPEELERFGSLSGSTTPHAEIEYGVEIPLMLQINTSKTAIRTFAPEAYFTPEEIASYGYEQVSVLTVMFSTEELV